jgi:hypothetical protein
MILLVHKLASSGIAGFPGSGTRGVSERLSIILALGDPEEVPRAGAEREVVV